MIRYDNGQSLILIGFIALYKIFKNFKNNKMKILVTGCAGFIGFHLSKNLENKKFHIAGIDNLNSYYSVKLKN